LTFKLQCSVERL